jgi:D-alanine-D-alanine ligase
MDAIAEEYIEGRELFMSILGARRLYALPLREIRFGRLPPGAPRVATYRAKWDERHRKKWGIENGAARGVSPALSRRTADICKLAYRALGLDGYARFDLRVTATGEVFVIEANANPSLGPDDELALSARRAGISYPELIRRITRLALARGR